MHIYFDTPVYTSGILGVFFYKVFSNDGWMNASAEEPKFYLGDSEFVQWLYIVTELI